MPEVQTNTTGSPEVFAMPKAKKAAERSSSLVHVVIPGVWAKVRVSGVDREPGETTACATPWFANSIAKVAQA